MVILWENTPEEVWDISAEEIKRRLYKVVGLTNTRIDRTSGKTDEYGTIILRFHQEAGMASDLKILGGAFIQNEDYKAQRKLYHNQFNALIEGVDFKISPLGEIKRLK